MIQTRKRTVEITELQCPQCGEWVIPGATISNSGKGICLRANCGTCNCIFEIVMAPDMLINADALGETGSA